MHNYSRRKGFTLIEIMIVVAIVGLLAAIAVPNFIQARRDNYAEQCRQNVQRLISANDQWVASVADTYELGEVTTQPTQADLVKFLPNGQFPTCPTGGTYVINGEGDPYCSLDEHVIEYEH